MTDPPPYRPLRPAPWSNSTPRASPRRSTAHPLAIVDFWAPWCAPCRGFAPVFAAAAARHPDVLFAKINTEAEQALAAQFDIRSIPTLMIFRDDIIVYAEAGALPAAGLEQVLTAARRSTWTKCAATSPRRLRARQSKGRPGHPDSRARRAALTSP